MSHTVFRPGMDNRGIGHCAYTDPRPVFRLFEDCAARNPEADALIHNGRHVSYAALDDKANGYAWAIQQAGLGRGDIVLLALPRGEALIAALIGAQKAGVVYLPIDQEFPAARVDYMAQDANARAVITHRENAASWQDKVSQIIFQEDIEATPARVEADVDWLEPMYVIYTSGTTGKPKGIMQCHQTVSNLVQWHNQASGIDCTGRVLQFASFGFDVYLQELFPALTTGGTVVLIDEQDRIDPAAVAKCITDSEISTLFLPVSVLSALFEDPSTLPDTLVHIVTAGEPLVITRKLREELNKRPNLIIWNHYGVSESHVVTQAGYSAATHLPENPNLGRPIDNVVISILNDDGVPAKDNEPGEIWISGACLAQGYINMPEKTAVLFRECDGVMWYRTGDYGYFLPGGEIVFTGRKDDQVKISGHLVVLSEVESALLQHPAVSSCACTVQGAAADGVILAHCTLRENVDAGALREFVSALLPSWSVPGRIVFHEKLPIGATGKVDRQALAVPEYLDRNQMGVPFEPASDALGGIILDTLESVLNLRGIGMQDTFALLGLSSLNMIRAATLLSQKVERTISPMAFFECADPAGLRDVLAGKPEKDASTAAERRATNKIAIIGMSGLFPGADDIATLWEAMLAGNNMLSRLEEEGDALPEAALLPKKRGKNRFIGRIEGMGSFDPSLFGLSARDALWMDPQQRKFLEQSWRCFEDAGIDPRSIHGRVGVFAGSAESTYLFYLQPRIRSSLDYLNTVISADKDFLATRVAWHLNLHGPAMNVQSACSTGLLAVHEACQAIRSGECDMALAGASSLMIPQERHIPYEPNTIFSEDGLTRPFDERRDGTTMTNAVAALLLKPLDAAQRDGDPIYAVISGTGVSNDGHRKASFSAPSVTGQAEAIRGALANAGVTPADISFIETHGTATKLGDQIELAALSQVFDVPERQGQCILSSVKANLGHANRAAGTVGLIAAVLSLSHRTVPGLAHFFRADEALALDRSPFRIAQRPERLPEKGTLYAGVSSFGIGGTNVHLVIESAPTYPEMRETAQTELLLLSASTTEKLDALKRSLVHALRKRPYFLSQVVNTLNIGRPAFKHRAAFVADSTADLCARLDGDLYAAHGDASKRTKSIWLFTDAPLPYLGAGKAFYDRNPTFRQVIDSTIAAMGENESGKAFSEWFGDAPSAVEYKQCAVWRPLSFMVQMAAARALMALGVQPDVIAGGRESALAYLVLSQACTLEAALTLMARLSEAGEAQEIGALINNFSAVLDPTDAKLDFHFVSSSTGQYLSVNALCEKETLRATLNRESAGSGGLRRPPADEMEEIVILGAASLSAAVPPIEPEKREVFLFSATAGDEMASFARVIGKHWCSGGHVDRAKLVAKWVLRINGLPGTVFEKREYMLPLEYPTSVPAQPTPTALPLAQQLWHRELRSEPPERLFDWAALVQRSPAWSVVGNDRQSKELAERMRRAGLVIHYVEPQNLANGLPADSVIVSATDAAAEQRLLLVARCLKAMKSAREAELLIVRHEDTTSPNFIPDAALATAAAVAAIEYPGIKCRFVTFDAVASLDVMDVQLATEMGALTERPQASTIVWREGGRFEETYSARAAFATNMPNLDKNSVVFITGGTGNVGQVLSDMLAVKLRCRLVLTGRRPMEEPGVKAQMRSLQERGSEAIYIPCDVNDEQQVYQALDLTVKKFGRLDLVFHLAASINEERFLCFLADLSEDKLKEQSDPKIRGMHALDNGLKALALAPERIAFSSISVTLGGAGYAPYTLANRLMLHEGLAAGWRLIHWDVFEKTAQSAGEGRIALGSSLKGAGLTGEDAWHALAHVLATSERKTAVFKFSPFNRPTSARKKTATLEPHSAQESDGLRERLSRLWADNLELDALPEHADFLALGGDSMAAIGITMDIRSSFAIEVPPEQLLNNTEFDAFARSIAELVRQANGGASYEDTLDKSIRLIWEEQLEQEHLAADTDFLSAGGDSVSAIGVTIDIRHQLGIDIDPDLLLRHPRLDTFCRAVRDIAEQRVADADSGLAEAIRKIWEDNLEVRITDRKADFLAAGGDSVSAIGVTMDIREKLGIDVTPDVLLQHTGLDVFIDKVAALTSPEPQHPMAQKPLSYRASPLQTRWFYMHREGYGNLIMPVSLKGDINVAALREAIDGAIGDFDALRTVYHEESTGIIRADVLSREKLTPTQILPEEAQASGQLGDLINALQASPLPLTAPPIRSWILRTSATSVLIIIHTHHICFDGWTTALLSDAIRSYYEDDIGPSDIKPYSLAAAEAYSWLEGTQGREQLARLRSLFKGAPLPVRPRPDRNGNDAERAAHKVNSTLSPQAVERMRGKAAANGVTLFTAMMAAFARLLSEFSGEYDLIFGTTSSGRMASGADRTVGVFVNPLPVRIKLDAENMQRSALTAAREATFMIQAGMRFPITELVEHVDPFTQRELNDAFTSYFLYQNFKKPSKWKGIEYEIGEPEDNTENSDLMPFVSKEEILMRHLELIVFERDDGSLSLNLWGRKGLYSSAWLQAILERYKWLADE
ncbi:amino acid adenylation domain-containing protein [Serratia marcescens]|nr:amino acid adenylation domain-containing protein [Serratia marcescens]